AVGSAPSGGDELFSAVVAWRVTALTAWAGAATTLAPAVPRTAAAASTRARRMRMGVSLHWGYSRCRNRHIDRSRCQPSRIPIRAWIYVGVGARRGSGVGWGR